MKTELTISALGHGIVLLCGFLSFGARPFDAVAIDSVPIDIVTASEFNRLTAGSKSAPKSDAAKPLVEKIAERKTSDSPTANVVDNKPEIVASVDKPALEPEPRKTQAKPQPEEPPQPKVDPIAEQLKRDEAHKRADERKKQEARKYEEAKKREHAKFDPKKVGARLALLDKREARRQAASGDTLNSQASLGSETGNAPQITANEIALLAAKLRGCWDVPAGLRDAENIKVPITIRLRPDGHLAAQPEPEIRAQDTQTQVMIDSVVRAFIKCQPYTMLSRANYDSWKELPFLFNPREMFGG
ncbi:MAG: hypothetical protein HY056_04235 [Proteobacteria bacterium]|nr:hypothetical protein [Pseudomonadota bacterium]